MALILKLARFMCCSNLSALTLRLPIATGRLVVLLLALASLATGSPRLLAQGGNLGGFGTLGGAEPTGQYPPEAYFIALDVYRSGDLEQAVRLFDQVQTRRDIRGRWVDSIPVLAMQAECYWHLGHLPAARANLDEVLRIAIRYRGWLNRVDWNSAMRPGVQVAPQSNLWPAAAAVRRLPVADRIQMGSGGIVNAGTIQRGGPIEELTVRTMDIVEIMRGLAIASYRRRILLGPLAAQDPLASQLLEGTKVPPGVGVAIAHSLVGSLIATAKFGYYDDKATVTHASQRALLNGGVHPLSAIAMLAQASALAGAKDPAAVGPVAASVGNAAASLRQPEWIGESMQLAAGCATTPQQADAVYTAAMTAATGMSRKSRLASLHCLVAAADAAVTAGKIDAAATALGQAQTLTSRRDVTQPRIDAYGAYVGARLAAARGASFGFGGIVTDVDKAVQTLRSFALNRRDGNRPVISMPRLYQLSLIQNATGKSIGGVSSEKLLAAFSDDPPDDVWRRDAVDGLAAVLVDRTATQQARVHLAAAQKYGEEVLKRGNALLSSRFNRNLPLGGRVAQVRVIARTDEPLLAEAAAAFQKDGGPMMTDLRQGALAMGNPTPAAAASLEAMACAIAFQRKNIPRAFPPPLNEKLPVSKLPPRTALLTFLDVGNKTYATLTVEGKTTFWPIRGASRLPGEIKKVLHAVGVGRTRGNRLPESDDWRKQAVVIRELLFPDDSVITAERMDELVIVPDGPLWYLPFELLPIAEEASPLIGDLIRIRYAPTPGLAMQETAMPPISRAIGVAADRFFAPADPDLNESITETILQAINDPVRLPETVDTSTGMLGNSIGHLVVAAPRVANPNDPLALQLAPYDQNPSGSVAGWMRFPAEVPRTVALAGFRTPVGAGQMGTGHEIFMTLCGLHAAGVRSVLLSRWAVGGESTAAALREYVQELPFSGAQASWRRAVMVLRGGELDPLGEPLLTKADHSFTGLTGDQPLFWAGYLISAPPAPSRR